MTALFYVSHIFSKYQATFKQFRRASIQGGLETLIISLISLLWSHQRIVTGFDFLFNLGFTAFQKYFSYIEGVFFEGGQKLEYPQINHLSFYKQILSVIYHQLCRSLINLKAISEHEWHAFNWDGSLWIDHQPSFCWNNMVIISPMIVYIQ